MSEYNRIERHLFFEMYTLHKIKSNNILFWKRLRKYLLQPNIFWGVIMPDVEYMLFCCRDLEHTCGFRVQSKTKEEAMEHARAHMTVSTAWRRSQGDGTQDRGSDKTCVCRGVRPNINILYIRLASSAQLCISHMESPEDTPVRQPMQRIFRYSNSFGKALVDEMASESE